MKNDISVTLPGISAGNLLDGIPLGIAIIDRDLQVVSMNRHLEVQTGYHLAEAKGVHVHYVLHSSLGGRGEALRNVIASGEAEVVEGDIINRDRKKIPVQFIISPLWNQSKVLVGLVLVLEEMFTVPSLAGELTRFCETDGIIGRSEKMQAVFELIPLMARTDASVLITGETGTGKDIIAEIIHNHSGRRKKPFIKINCGALPENLLESELFGHTRGAFTGAVRDKAGMFKMADGGTLFLTEIGDMPLPLQVKLLSVLDDKTYYPLGSEKRMKVDVRVIAATHRALHDRVESGEFREDLFYRLNVLQLHLPSLRERGEDVRYLLQHYLNYFSDKNGKEIRTFTERALSRLTAYEYPGNIRELRNIVEYGVCICQQVQMDVEHLPRYLLSVAESEIQSSGAACSSAVSLQNPASTMMTGESATGATKDWGGLEKDLIVKTMLQTRGNRSKAAEILGWGRTTLWRKLKLHGLMPMANTSSKSRGIVQKG
jgi:transcriptional regulator with PAS, ATPase and Fis domain